MAGLFHAAASLGITESGELVARRAASVIVVGLGGATISYREGRYLPLSGESA